MPNNAYEKQRREFLWNRTPVDGKCMKPVPDQQEIFFCSKLVMTDEPECYCEAYIDPKAKWRNGDCPLANQFLRIVETVEQKKVRVGQQKHSKKRKTRR